VGVSNSVMKEVESNVTDTSAPLDRDRMPGAPSHQRGSWKRREEREVARKCRVYTVADAIETKETQLADLGSQAETLYTTGSLTIGTRRRAVV